MIFTSILKKTSEEAVEYFREKDLNAAYDYVDNLRKLVVWSHDSWSIIKEQLQEAGICSEISSYEGVKNTLDEMDRIQMRLVQLRDYYESEAMLQSVQEDYTNFIPSKRIKKIIPPQWKM